MIDLNYCALKITTLNQDYVDAVLIKSGGKKNYGNMDRNVLCFVYFVTNKTFLTIFSSSIVFKKQAYLGLL
jgi:hypothetical protein